MKTRLNLFALLLSILIAVVLFSLGGLRVDSDRRASLDQLTQLLENQAKSFDQRLTQDVQGFFDRGANTPLDEFDSVAVESAIAELAFVIEGDHIIWPPPHDEGTSSWTAYELDLAPSYRLLGQGQWTDAIESCEQVLTREGLGESARGECLLLRSDAYDRMEEIGLAIEDCKTILDLYDKRPSHPLAIAAMIRLGRLTHEGGDTIEFDEALDRLLESNSLLHEDALVFDMIRSLLLEMDDVEKTRGLLEALDKSRLYSQWIQAIETRSNELNALATDFPQAVVWRGTYGEIFLTFRKTDDRIYGGIIQGSRFIQEFIEPIPSEIHIIDKNGESLFSKGLESPKETVSATLEGPLEWTLLSPLSDSWKNTQKESAQRTTVLFFGVGVFIIALVFMGTRTIKKQIELAELKSQFVANVSHELKTPLTMIRMFSEMLTEGYSKDPEDAHKALSVIDREARRLEALLDNALTVSKESSGKLELSKGSHDLGVLLKEIAEEFTPFLKHKGFHVSLDLSKDLGIIQVDPGALSQIVGNLLTNAVKYSLHVKDIELQARRSDDGVRIRVSDRGVGLTQQQSAEIFERFRRVRGGALEHVAGIGIGLSVVKSLVEEHRGWVRAEPREGGGSTFLVYLPIR